MKGIPEEQRHKTVSPRVSAKQIQDLEIRTGQANSGQQFELEICSRVDLTLDVVFQNDFG